MPYRFAQPHSTSHEADRRANRRVVGRRLSLPTSTQPFSVIYKGFSLRNKMLAIRFESPLQSPQEPNITDPIRLQLLQHEPHIAASCQNYGSHHECALQRTRRTHRLHRRIRAAAEVRGNRRENSMNCGVGMESAAGRGGSRQQWGHERFSKLCIDFRVSTDNGHAGCVNAHTSG